MADFEKHEKSLSRLRAQYENFLNMDKRKELSPVDKEAVAESVVQRFETCYDCLWKTLKHYFSLNMGLAGIPNSPKPVFKTAFAA